MKKIHLISLIALSVTAVATLSIGMTYAAYVKYGKIDQNITAAGRRSIYLKPTSQWNGDSPKYFVYYCTSGDVSKPSQWVPSIGHTGVGNDTVYAFPLLDSTTYPNLVFVRADTRATIDTIGWNSGNVWNQTKDLTIGETVSGIYRNMYTITAIGSSGAKSTGSWSVYGG